MTPELDKCPFCGDTTGFYRTGTVNGKYAYHYPFTERSADNTGLHDGLRYHENKSRYCSDCDKKLPKIFNEITLIP